VLTLTRSVGETIRIGDDIEVHVVEVRGGTVRLGFKAPREVAIHREEVYRQIAEANLLAAQVTADSLGALAAFAPAPGSPAAEGAGEGVAPGSVAPGSMAPGSVTPGSSEVSGPAEAAGQEVTKAGEGSAPARKGVPRAPQRSRSVSG
jgi:carbon storage regulator